MFALLAPMLAFAFAALVLTAAVKANARIGASRANMDNNS